MTSRQLLRRLSDPEDQLTQRMEKEFGVETPPTEYKHPSFIRAAALAEPLRSHFPKSVEEAQAWQPMQHVRALSSRVLVVAQTRVECSWAAYCDAVPGYNHRAEVEPVLDHGDKLSESLARALFPEFDEVPYAE